MILVPVRVRCDEPGCDREFEAVMPFTPYRWSPPALWAMSVAPLTEAEFQEGAQWRLPGKGELTTAPMYCPSHAPKSVQEEP